MRVVIGISWKRLKITLIEERRGAVRSSRRSYELDCR
jgi:hypothetical protein